MESSRSKNVFKNIIMGLLCQCINLLLSFMMRSVFIRTLGVEYLGLNGLFSNILTVLSFAELGIGNAIIFSLYKPLAIGDEKKIASLMLLYKQSYTTLCVVVVGLGIAVIPFLGFLIKEPPNIPENLTLLYVLFLLNTGLSYLNVYKKSILIADQKSYIVLFINEIFFVIHFLLNIYILYIPRNFILYLVFNIIFTVSENIFAGAIAYQKYPYLRKKAQKIDRDEQRQIFKNVKALAVYKFGSVIVNGTDNIIISAIAGITQVGFVSNYTLITSSCNAILGRIEEAFMSSIGNLNATSSSDKKYEIFEKVFLISFWIYGFATCGLVVLLNDFITLWLGNDFCLNEIVVVAICLELFVSGMQNPAYMYRTTLGLFREGQLSAFIACVLNIVLSIMLYYSWGLCGVFFATSISKLLSYGVVDPVLIYKKAFNKNVLYYYLNYFLKSLLLISICCFLLLVSSYVTIGGLLGFIVKIFLISIIYNGILFIIYYKSKNFHEILYQVKNVVLRKKQGV